MKDSLDRTKVVLRHLPPGTSQAALMEQIDDQFAGLYNWAFFCPGKISQKNQRHSRAYIDLKNPEDVIRFAEFFDGHMFVNEKGAQFRTLVEYAPSQRVPKACSRKDGREGTIFKDPEYLEFLEHLAKPAEILPSAEIQMERREAERAGGQKETLMVTPLMEYVRQKRAAKSGSQRSANGKASRRTMGASPSSYNPSARRGSDKRKATKSMYVLRDNTKNSNGNDKSSYILLSRREEQSASGTEALGGQKVPGGIETEKRRVVLLKGKEKEISPASGGSLKQQNGSTSVRNSQSSAAFKQSQRNDASVSIIRSILSKKDARHGHSNLALSHTEQQTSAPNLERDTRRPRPPGIHPIMKDAVSGISPASQRQVGRRGIFYGVKEVDSSPNVSDGKPSKRGGPSGYCYNERQVWVQKSGSGS